MITKQLLNFSGKGDVITCRVFPLDAQGVIDLGQFPGGKFNVQNRADHLTDHTLGASRCRSRSDHRKESCGIRRCALEPIQSGATIPLLRLPLTGSVTRTT